MLESLRRSIAVLRVRAPALDRESAKVLEGSFRTSSANNYSTIRLRSGGRHYSVVASRSLFACHPDQFDFARSVSGARTIRPDPNPLRDLPLHCTLSILTALEHGPR